MLTDLAANMCPRRADAGGLRACASGLLATRQEQTPKARSLDLGACR